jgi:hydroxymethylbilane synthase
MTPSADNKSSTSKIRLGTRASALAQWQANWVASRLERLSVTVEMVPISTVGDRQQQGPIGAMGGQGVFTKEIQRALLDNLADLAVHSLKDLPTDDVPGLCLAAVPERAQPGDALVSRKWGSLDELPEGAVIGSGSLRRQSQLLRARPDLKLRDIRGNVDTRLKKLDNGDFDALILAEAGLRRLGLEENITQILPTSIMLPAVGQAALGLETRVDDRATRDLVEQLIHPDSFGAVTAERSMLAALRGGCLAPIGASGRVDDDGRLVLTGRVLSPDGSSCLENTATGQIDEAQQLGQEVARLLLDRGAADLIAASRQD